MPLDQQLQLLEHGLYVDEGVIPRTMPPTPVSEFILGDEAGIEASNHSVDLLEEEYLDLLVRRRNERLAQRILEHLKDGKRSLFALGAGHVVGPKGVVELLRRAGKTVTRVE
jgi:uncharacterized protein YbaP (TraB family)